MRVIRNLLLTTFVLSIISLCGQSVAAQNIVAGNEYGDRLEIIDFEPELPATLTMGNKLFIKIAYQLKSTTNCRIWARPYTDGKRTPNYFAHPSPLYKNGSGQLYAFFGFKQPGHVDQVQIKMSCEGSSILVLIANIDANWIH